MKSTSLRMTPRKHIALVAHDHQKACLLAWAKRNRVELGKHELFGTGTTGGLVQKRLGLKVTKYHSGPLGGDLEIGAAIVRGEIDMLIFFWDPLQAQPHDPDVKALLRLCVVWNIPLASNTATADFLIRSPYMQESYTRQILRPGVV